MYIRLSTKRSKGKTYQYLQLCEAYRNQKGQACTRVLGNFGRIDQLNRKKIDSAINGLLGYASNPSITRLSDLGSG
jgi:hypothetical protein